MGQSRIKKVRKIARETAKQYALDTHLETIRQYIDGIIELPYWKRRRVCKAIMKKHNPFGSTKLKHPTDDRNNFLFKMWMNFKKEKK